MAEDNKNNLIDLTFTETSLNSNIQTESTKNTLPNNLEAEQNLLGAILFDNTLIEQTIDLVKEYYFYEPFHKEIYKACLYLFDNNQLADPTTKGILKDTNIKTN